MPRWEVSDVTTDANGSLPNGPPAEQLALVRKIWRHPAATAVLALLLVLALGLIFSGNGAFYRWSTHRDALRQASVFGILACGMTLVIIKRGSSSCRLSLDRKKKAKKP